MYTKAVGWGYCWPPDWHRSGRANRENNGQRRLQNQVTLISIKLVRAMGEAAQVGAAVVPHSSQLHSAEKILRQDGSGRHCADARVVAPLPKWKRAVRRAF